MNIYRFLFRRISSTLWFLPAVFSLSAVFALLIAYFSAGLFPKDFDEANLPFSISADALRNILGIVAASMLTVAVFALSSLVSLLTNAAQTGSPRAVPLFSGNRAAQTTVSVFIGAFLFSIVGIIGLSGGFYPIGSRLVLFGATLLMLFAVVWSLIRWVRELSLTGRINEITLRLEETTCESLERAGRDGLYSCGKSRPGRGGVQEVRADSLGYIQHFDAASLQRIAEREKIEIHVSARPGDYVDQQSVLARIPKSCNEETASKIARHFIIGRNRTFDLDPRYGLQVLGEIARRALSPGINDPGTATHVVTVQTRLLTGWARQEEVEEPAHPRVFCDPITADDLFVAAYHPILRDAGSSLDTLLALLEGLKTLDDCSRDVFGQQVARLSAEIGARGKAELSHAQDRALLKNALPRSRRGK